jgi:putative transposase
MRLQCELCNAALEERRMTYEWQRKGISSANVPGKLDQFRTLTGLALLGPELAPYGITVYRGTLTLLDEAFQGFFRRLKAGEARLPAISYGAHCSIPIICRPGANGS